jgi:hypothetical protein
MALGLWGSLVVDVLLVLLGCFLIMFVGILWVVVVSLGIGVVFYLVRISGGL